MKGQPSNKADDKKIIEAIKDKPGIRCAELAKKLGKAANTITTKVKRLTDERRIFRQKQGIKNSSGFNYNLFTVHYARKNNLSSVYRGVDADKSTLELQMMFNGLIRGLPCSS